MQNSKINLGILLIPGLVLGALVQGVAAGASLPSPSEPVGSLTFVAGLTSPWSAAGARIFNIAATGGGGGQGGSGGPGSSGDSAGSGGSGDQGCPAESPCLNGKAVGGVLGQILQGLDLSTNQATAIQSILSGEKTAIDAIKAALKKLGKKATKAQRDAAKANIDALKTKDRAAIEKLLTTTQLAELAAIEKIYCAQQAAKGGQQGSGAKGGHGQVGPSGGNDSSGPGSGSSSGAGATNTSTTTYSTPS